MADEKNGPPNTSAEAASDPSRRQFFAKLGLGSLSIAAAGTVAFSYQYLDPNVLYEPSPVVNEGKPERYPLDSVTLDVNAGIYIIHSQEGYFSLSAVCTHLGCITRWVEDDETIACPCHGSKFTRDGLVAQGPAPRPLRRIAIRLEDGELVVDTAVEVEKDAILRA